MSETRGRSVRIEDGLWDGAADTLRAIERADAPLWVTVLVRPGATRTDVIRELLRTLTEDVETRPRLVVVPREGATA